MVSRQEYDEAKKVLAEIHQELATQPLTPEQRKELQLHSARLAGQLCSVWFPVYWSRRLIMLAIFLIGLQQAWVGNYYGLLLWLLLPTFSPRIMGEATFLWGRLSRDFREGFEGRPRRP